VNLYVANSDHISQGNVVATVLKWDGQTSHLRPVSFWCYVLKLSKSASVLRSYSKNKRGTFCETRCTCRAYRVRQKSNP